MLTHTPGRPPEVQASKEIAMIKTLLILGTATGLVFASAASAGNCTTAIEDLQKQMSSSDAGMGPTGTGTAGAAAGTVAETGNLQPPTDAMNEATAGKATSSSDVLNQNQGAPTSAEASGTGQLKSNAAQADEAIQRARELDQAGDETACMTEVGNAKAQLGVQ